MHEVRTTAQVADLLGVADTTIRAAKSRHPDKLLENKHWGKGTDDKLWWTEAGCEQLSQLIPSANPYQVATPNGSHSVARSATLTGIEDGAVVRRLSRLMALEHLRQRLQPKVEEQYQVLISGLNHLLEHPEQTPEQGLEDALRAIGLSIATVRAARAFANADATKILSEV